MSTNMNPIPNTNIASLTWKIDKFPTLSRGPISSPNFSSQTSKNTSFFLALHPNANFNYSPTEVPSIISDDQIVILLVKYYETSHTTPVQYRVSIVNSKGEKGFTIVKQVKLGDPENVVTSNHKCTYRRDFVIDPENGLLDENGTLTIHCEVEVLDDLNSRVFECYDSMAQDYGSLLESGKFSDVILVVDGHELKAHANILSIRSKVFAAMLKRDRSTKKRTNRVDIADVDREVLDDLLRFVYTGKVESLDQHAADLLAAADKYQLDQLKSICTHHLTTHLTPESVARTLVVADMHHVTELKDKCIEYITKQEGGIKLVDWKVICESNIELAHSLFQSAAQK